MASLVPLKGDWNNFLKEYLHYAPEYVDLSDEEEKEFMEKEFNKTLNNIVSPTSPENRKKQTKKKKTNSNYMEPSNAKDISYAEKKIENLGKSSNRFHDLVNTDGLGFRLNNRTLDKIDKQTDSELNRIRDIANDKTIRVEGTCIVLQIPKYAKKIGADTATFKRQMYPEELKQVSKAKYPIASPFVSET